MKNVRYHSFYNNDSMYSIYMYVCIIYIIKNVNHTIVTYYILINIINSIINDTNNT